MGGVLGKKFILSVADDACDPKQTVAGASNMVRNGVVLMASHFSSVISIMATKVYEEEWTL